MQKANRPTHHERGDSNNLLLCSKQTQLQIMQLAYQNLSQYLSSIYYTSQLELSNLRDY